MFAFVLFVLCNGWHGWRQSTGKAYKMKATHWLKVSKPACYYAWPPPEPSGYCRQIILGNGRIWLHHLILVQISAQFTQQPDVFLFTSCNSALAQ